MFSWIAYVSVPFVFLCTVSNSPSLPQAVRYYLRATLYLSTMGFVAVTAAFIGLGMNLIGQRYNVNYIVAKTFYALASRVIDVKVEVEGQELLDKTKGAVIMCNHQSMLDILFVGRIFPTRTSIMSKKSLLYSPLGPFMQMSGSIFIDRGNTARAMRSMEAAASTMKNETIGLWVFPEGTRHCEEQSDLLPFKKGGFHLAVQAQAPIIPVVCENYWWLYRSGIFGTGTLKLRVLPPVETHGLKSEDVNALVTRVRGDMLIALREISDQEEDKTVGRGKYSSPTPQPMPPPPPTLLTSPSNESLSSSTTSSSHQRNSEGGDTEEDEGMVLVGRPKE